MSESIYATVLGESFHRLHPKIQERFGFDSKSRKRAIGRGVMDRVWRGKFFTIPFLRLGAWRNIMFPEQGENVPFTIENWAYVDALGRETVTELRTFKLGRERRDFHHEFTTLRFRPIAEFGTWEGRSRLLPKETGA